MQGKNAQNKEPGIREKTALIILEILEEYDYKITKDLLNEVSRRKGASHVPARKALSDLVYDRKVFRCKEGKTVKYCLPEKVDRLPKSRKDKDDLGELLLDLSRKIVVDLTRLNRPQYDARSETFWGRKAFEEDLVRRCENLYILARTYEDRRNMRFKRPWDEAENQLIEDTIKGVKTENPFHFGLNPWLFFFSCLIDDMGQRRIEA